MTENDKAWERNTPAKRAERRANWESWTQKRERESERRWNGVSR